MLYAQKYIVATKMRTIRLQNCFTSANIYSLILFEIKKACIFAAHF